MRVVETEANKLSERPTQWDLGALQTVLPWKRGGGEREKECEYEREKESIRG